MALLDTPDARAATALTGIAASTGEFRCRATERAFQERNLAESGERIGRHGLYLAAIFVGFALSDLAELGTGREWFTLFALRMAAAAAMALVSLGFSRDPLAYLGGARAIGLLLSETCAIAVFLVVCWMRPADTLAHAVSAVLFVLVVVLFVPGRARTKAAVALAFLGGFVAVGAARFDLPAATLASFAGALGASVLVTFAVSANLSRALRTEWLVNSQIRAANDRLVEEARRAELLREELYRQATQDPLTGLANRRWFFERGEELLATARRGGRAVTVLLMDADGFKQINDLHGHATGDAVLAALGAALAAHARRGELVGRIGGEEFAVVAEGLDDAGARALAERLRAAVRAATVPADGCTIGVTVSVGFTQVGRGESLAEALQRADRAMYEAKRSGGDRILCGVA